MNLSPIVLFAYNRPRHLKATLESLSRNRLADQSLLIVHSDGPKTTKDVSKIREVRQILHQKKWCGKMRIIEDTHNIGLGEAWVQRFTDTINTFGRCIVIQDDFYLSPGFLPYMNDALMMYEKIDRVMHISGYMYPEAKGLPDTFFLPVCSIWGFATWKRAWRYLETDPKKLLNTIIAMDGISRFNMNGGCDAFEQLKKNADGLTYTFDVYWSASVFIRNGLALHPKISLVRNLGIDGSGKNCNVEPDYSKQEIIDGIAVKKIPLVVSEEAMRCIQRYYAKKKSLLERIKYFPYSSYNRLHSIYKLLKRKQAVNFLK